MISKVHGIALAALLVASLAVSANAQPTEEEINAVKESMRQVTLRNPLYISLPEDRNCKNDAMDFILGCLELLPWVDNELGVALNRVANINGEIVLVNGEVLLETIAKNPPIPFACCAPLCNLAKAGCACNDIMYNNMVDLMGGKENVAVDVINKLRNTCVVTHPALVFEPTLKNTQQCGDSYEAIAQGWKCA